MTITAKAPGGIILEGLTFEQSLQLIGVAVNSAVVDEVIEDAVEAALAKAEGAVFEVTSLIRASSNEAVARRGVAELLDINESEAQAVLDATSVTVGSDLITDLGIDDDDPIEYALTALDEAEIERRSELKGQAKLDDLLASGGYMAIAAAAQPVPAAPVVGDPALDILTGGRAALYRWVRDHDNPAGVTVAGVMQAKIDGKFPESLFNSKPHAKRGTKDNLHSAISTALSELAKDGGVLVRPSRGRYRARFMVSAADMVGIDAYDLLYTQQKAAAKKKAEAKKAKV